MLGFHCYVSSSSHLLLFLVELNMSCFFLAECFCGVFQCFFLSTSIRTEPVSKRFSVIHELNNGARNVIGREAYDVRN